MRVDSLHGQIIIDLDTQTKTKLRAVFFISCWQRLTHKVLKGLFFLMGYKIIRIKRKKIDCRQQFLPAVFG